VKDNLGYRTVMTVSAWLLFVGKTRYIVYLKNIISLLQLTLFATTRTTRT